MFKNNIPFKSIIFIIFALLMFNFSSFSISLKNATTLHTNHTSAINSYFLPSINKFTFFNTYIHLLPIEAFIDLYNYRIESVLYTKDIYLSGDKISAQLDLSNRKTATKKLWLGYTLKDPTGRSLDFHGKEVTLAGKSNNTVEINIDQDYFSNDFFISGEYDASFALWDQNPALEGAKRINHYEKENAIRIFSTMESFGTFDSNQWFSREGMLGRSLLTPKNVFIKDDLLNIRLGSNSYSGGEIRSLETVHYGSYEISMQLPDAPSSITGFFLYKAPDYDYEIDIEIYNKKVTEILFTTYANGAVQNNTVFPLDFDPTSTFNSFRIDYYPHEVSFYVNDELFEKFTDGFPKEPMYLLVNTWYPTWLEGIQQKSDQHLKIQWIRH